MIISAFFRVYAQKATGVSVSKIRGEDKMTNNITQTDDVLIKPVVLNYTVKDFDGNFEKIETAYKEAVEEGVDLHLSFGFCFRKWFLLSQMSSKFSNLR